MRNCVFGGETGPRGMPCVLYYVVWLSVVSFHCCCCEPCKTGLNVFRLENWKSAKSLHSSVVTSFIPHWSLSSPSCLSTFLPSLTFFFSLCLMVVCEIYLMHFGRYTLLIINTLLYVCGEWLCLYVCINAFLLIHAAVLLWGLLHC